MWQYQKDMDYQAATEVAIETEQRRELPPLDCILRTWYGIELVFVSPFLKLATWSNMAGDCQSNSVVRSTVLHTVYGVHQCLSFSCPFYRSGITVTG